MRSRKTTVLVTAWLLAVATSPALGISFSLHKESFDSTTYKDVANTTADWNTAAGELRLFPFAMTLAGSRDTPGTAFQAAVDGDYALVADQARGLQILDISDPTNPTIIGSFDTPGDARDVAVAGDVAFVADGDSLIAVNLTNPASPARLGAVAMSARLARSVALAGDIAYVADWSAGIHAVDIGDPTTMTVVGTVATPGDANNVVVDGNYAFVADWNAHLSVVDVRNPNSMIVVGGLTLSGSAFDVAVDGDRAYVVTGGTGGLHVIDVGSPSSPLLLGSYDTPGSARGVWVTGDHVYVADAGSGLLAFDASNPASPALVAILDTPGSARGVVVDGTRAYVTDEGSGLQVIDVAEALDPPLLAGGYDTPGVAYDVVVAGDTAYLVDDNFGLQVFGISDPTSPVLRGNYDTPDAARGLAVAGNHVYVADGASGLLVIDISDPESPVLAGSYNTPGSARGVAVAGDFAYVADGAPGLHVIDIANPKSPALLGSYNTPDAARSVAVAGRYAYVADALSGLQVIDISNPAAPTLAGSYNTLGSAEDVVVAGNYAYVAGALSGLQVIDISTPSSPSLAATYNTPGRASGVTVAGDYAYVADGSSGLQVIDISDPTNPTLGGSYDTGFASGVAVAGDLAYVANDATGLQVVQVLQRRFDLTRNRGQSVAVDKTDREIAKVALTTVQTDSIRWEISADGGTNWQTIPTDGLLRPVSVLGSDLRWRSTHVYTDVGINPSCSKLELRWRTVLTIANIQAPDEEELLGDCRDQSSIVNGETWTMRGIVRVKFGGDYYLTDPPPGGPRTGVRLSTTRALTPGHRYLMEVVVRDSGETYLELADTNYVDEGAAAEPDPVVQSVAVLRDTTCDAARSLLTGEDYEGVLIQVQQVMIVEEKSAGESFRVAGPSPTFDDTILVANAGGHSFDPDSGNIVSVTGILSFQSGSFVILPRNGGDIELETPEPGWTPEGFLVSGPDSRDPSMTTDREGGAIIAWQRFAGAPSAGATGDRTTRFPGGRAVPGNRLGPGGALVETIRLDQVGSVAWPAGGVAVADTSSNQTEPATAPDGSGGVIIVWVDDRGGTLDLYAQRAKASGERAPGWPSVGAPVVVAPGDQRSPTVVPDGEGGVFVFFQSGSPADIYAQRITGSGTIAPGWPALGGAMPGVPICLAAGDQSQPAAVADGTGGAIVAWTDTRSGQSDIYGFHILANAAAAAGWPANGLAVCAEAGDQSDPTIVGDRLGGAIVVWSDRRGAAADIYALRIDGAGQIFEGWPGGGVALCSAAGDQLFPRAAPDDHEGAIVTWEDRRPNGGRGIDIYAQHVLGKGGEIDLAWPSDGLLVCGEFGDQVGPAIVSDDAGGACLAWEDARGLDHDIYATLVLGSGFFDPRFPVDGIPLSRAPNHQLMPAMVMDGSGGAIVAWTDYRNVVPEIYATRLFGASSPSPTDVGPPSPSEQIRLLRPWPNPSSGPVTIGFELAARQRVHAELFDVAGRSIQALVKGSEFAAGTHALVWDGRDRSGAPARSGVYFMRFRAGSVTRAAKMLVLR